MFIITKHATPCNPSRLDAQDQSGYHADFKGLLKPEANGKKLHIKYNNLEASLLLHYTPEMTDYIVEVTTPFLQYITSIL